MKKICSLFLALTLVFCLAAVAYAESPADLVYQYSRPGTVHCSRLTVRSSPSTSGSEYGKLKNGQTCTILGEENGWWIVDLASCGFSNHSSGYGYAKKSLISLDPCWIVVDPYTYLYTDPWYSGKSNGEQLERVYLVLSENPEFYCVQCTESAAGSSFIRKSDVPRYSNDWQSLYVIAADNVPLFDNPGGVQINTLARFTIVSVSSWDGSSYYYVRVNPDTPDEYCGWVELQYVQRVIN